MIDEDKIAADFSAALSLAIAKGMALDACRLVTTEKGGHDLALKFREYADWPEAGAFEKND